MVQRIRGGTSGRVLGNARQVDRVHDFGQPQSSIACSQSKLSTAMDQADKSDTTTVTIDPTATGPATAESNEPAVGRWYQSEKAAKSVLTPAIYASVPLRSSWHRLLFVGEIVPFVLDVELPCPNTLAWKNRRILQKSKPAYII